MRIGSFGLVGALVLASGCGIALRRDLAEVAPQSVVYDDMCGVQAYHDGIETGKYKGPRLLHSSEMGKAETDDHPLGGMATFSFDDEANLGELRRVLRENYDRLPPGLLTASPVELEVQWAEKAGVRRVVTTRDAQISDGGKGVKYLPYHICLSELLYGGPLYRTRRAMLNLPPLEAAPAAAVAATPPANAPPPATTPAVPMPVDPSQVAPQLP
jgi:hypothetical protein